MFVRVHLPIARWTSPSWRDVPEATATDRMASCCAWPIAGSRRFLATVEISRPHESDSAASDEAGRACSGDGKRVAPMVPARHYAHSTVLDRLNRIAGHALEAGAGSVAAVVTALQRISGIGTVPVCLAIARVRTLRLL